jgi:hypothetical protein
LNVGVLNHATRTIVAGFSNGSLAISQSDKIVFEDSGAYLVGCQREIGQPFPNLLRFNFREDFDR